ncbi:MAG: AsmA family protein [Magnetococcales bacterium]|nr:AsmA family protein [Magnetococcales bacterium]
MSRLLSALIIAFSAGLFLLLTALLVVPILVDPNDYKASIRHLVHQKTGHALRLHETIEISMGQFPQLTLALGQSEIEAVPGFGQEPLVTVDTLTMRVKLLPLLVGSLQVTHLSLAGLQVNLVRGRTGWGNWQGAKPSVMAHPAPLHPLDLSLLANLKPGEIHLADAEINYHDQRTGHTLSLTDLSFTTTPLESGLESQVGLRGKWMGTNPPSHGHFDLGSRVLLQKSAQTIQLQKMILTVHGHHPGATLKEMELDAKTDLLYHLNEGSAIFTQAEIHLNGWMDGLSFREGGISLKGTIEVGAKQASLRLPKVDLTARIKSDHLPPAGIELRSRSDLFIDLNRASAKGENLQINGPVGMFIRGSISGQNLKTQPTFSGNLAVDPFDFQALMIALGQHLPDPAFWKKTALTTRFQASLTDAVLSPLTLQLDETSLTGSLSLTNPVKPAVVFDLKGDHLDLDPYLPTKADQTLLKTSLSSTLPAPLSPKSHPSLAAWKRWNVDGKIALEQLQVRGVVLTDLFLTTSLREGIIRVPSLEGQLSQGQWEASMALDLNQHPPYLQLDNTLLGVEAASLLTPWTGTDYLAGTTWLTTQLQSRGFDTKSLLNTLQGTLSLTMKEGEIRGLGMVETIHAAYATLVDTPEEKLLATKRHSTETTPFSQLTATATLENGILKNQDLEARSPQLHLQGGGEANLATKWLDYTLSADLYTALKDLDANRAQKLKGKALSIRIRGPLGEAELSTTTDPDLSTLIRSTLKRAPQQEKGAEQVGGKEKVIRSLEWFEPNHGEKPAINKLGDEPFGF